MLGMSDRAWMVTLPLYANEMLYGILVCDLTDEVLEYGEFLSNQISAAVKMLNLLKNNENIQKQLEGISVCLKGKQSGTGNTFKERSTDRDL